jgi:phosphonopyruvate decarboxylase
MIQPEQLYNFFQQQGITFFTGVPDSLLKHFLKYINDNAAESNHIITSNEGLAIALASGYHFSSGKTPLVYLQNSGLGNIINPLTSLADKEMYSVPMLLLIGWRGKPGVKDEPQHKKMGRITLPLLDVLEIPYYLLDGDEQSSFQKIKDAVIKAAEEKRPVALIAPGEIFEEYAGANSPDKYSLQREQVIQKIILSVKGNETVICTTGKTGREFYEQNLKAGKKISKYLLSAGAMGHANHIALGIKSESNERIIMLDGDGALLMHMGSLATIAHHAANNFVHIVINNGSHESVGGQPTEAFKIDCCAIAKACGYKKMFCITNEEELGNWLKNNFNDAAVQFVEIRTSRESRSDLGRPLGNPAEWKESFMSSFKKKN